MEQISLKHAGLDFQLPESASLCMKIKPLVLTQMAGRKPESINAQETSTNGWWEFIYKYICLLVEIAPTKAISLRTKFHVPHPIGRILALFPLLIMGCRELWVLRG